MMEQPRLKVKREQKKNLNVKDLTNIRRKSIIVHFWYPIVKGWSKKMTRRNNKRIKPKVRKMYKQPYKVVNGLKWKEFNSWNLKNKI